MERRSGRGEVHPCLGLRDLLGKLGEAAVRVLELSGQRLQLTRQLVESGPHVRVGAEDRGDLLRQVLVELVDLFLRARLLRKKIDLLFDVADVLVKPLDVRSADTASQGGREEERPHEGSAPPEPFSASDRHFAVMTKWPRRFCDHADSSWPSTNGRSSP